jgi:hypothetical protein
MPSLSDWQQAFAHAVMGEGEVAGLGLLPAPVPAACGLDVYRGTVRQGLVQCLRLTFPTIVQLGGDDWFDTAAADYARAAPPRAADLSGYGADFPRWLRERLPPEFSYFSEVARFDHTLDRVLRLPLSRQELALDAAVMLDLPASLAVLNLAAPADLIRDALEDEAALAALDVSASRHLALWRRENQVAVMPLHPAAAHILAALLAGGAVETAMAQAMETHGADAALAAIRDGIFAAPFCRVISNMMETDHAC